MTGPEWASRFFAKVDTDGPTPTHLEPVVRRENFLRGDHPTAVSVRTNRCQSGRHDLTEDNTIHRAAGKRECRACDNEGQRRRHAARKVGA